MLPAVPHGVIRVPTRNGEIRSFLVRNIRWGASIIILADDGREHIIPFGHYDQASDEDTRAYWLKLRHTIAAGQLSQLRQNLPNSQN